VKALGLLSLLFLVGCAHRVRAPADVGAGSIAAPHSTQTSEQSPKPGEPSPSPPAAAGSARSAPSAKEGAAGASAPTPPSLNTTRPKPSEVVPRAAPTAAARPSSLKPASVPAPLDLTSLEQRLRDTHAIGVFTKLSLKNQVDDLLATVREYHNGQGGRTSLQDVKQQYDQLLLKVLNLLQDRDPPLASSIRESRDAIWNLLADRDQFQKFHL
jgi:hypothetical protein